MDRMGEVRALHPLPPLRWFLLPLPESVPPSPSPDSGAWLRLSYGPLAGLGWGAGGLEPTVSLRAMCPAPTMCSVHSANGETEHRR